MEITVQELKRLERGSFQLIDIRDANQIAHGAIPGAVCISADAIAESPLIAKEKMLIICCSRGEYSRKTAESLCDQGFAAASLAIRLYGGGKGREEGYLW